jgi:phosphate transport system protein
MRTRFEMQLETLNEEIIGMGALVEIAMKNAMQALVSGDAELAQKNIEADKDIDQKMKDIESLCLKLLLSQQPVARDLRLISAALKMVSDLERIGDQCADISEIVMTFPKGTEAAHLEYIPKMAEAVHKMISESVDAFVHRDVELARTVVDYDDVVDHLYDDVRRTLVELVRKDSDAGEGLMDLLLTAKYLERIGDHAVNVAKWVIFSVTGTRNGTGFLTGPDEVNDK